jgi:hypothetical protein
MYAFGLRLCGVKRQNGRTFWFINNRTHLFQIYLFWQSLDRCMVSCTCTVIMVVIILFLLRYIITLKKSISQSIHQFMCLSTNSSINLRSLIFLISSSLAPTISRVTPRTYKQRNMIMLLRIIHSKAKRNLI